MGRQEQIDKACEAMDAEVQAGFQLGVEWADENPERIGSFKVCKENDKLREMLAIAVEALKFADDRFNHACNIEYGNDTGIENCVKCKLRKAIAKIEELNK